MADEGFEARRGRRMNLENFDSRAAHQRVALRAIAF